MSSAMVLSMGGSMTRMTDMGGMSTMTATATAAAASATSAAISMDMGGGSCKISMLWNWYTIDSCFIASSWRITSNGVFAGSCIGVVLLVMSLEFLRRGSKEYDRYILRQATQQVMSSPAESSRDSSLKVPDEVPTTLAPAPKGSVRGLRRGQFRPSLLQQVIRAALHMVQFAVAYFIMLLAMYYNGYIIISIIIGAFLGAFVFSWETLSLSDTAKEEVTYCCG